MMIVFLIKKENVQLEDSMYQVVRVMVMEIIVVGAPKLGILLYQVEE